MAEDFKETRNQSNHFFTLKPNLLNGIYPVFKKSNADRSYQEQKNLDVLYAQIGDLLES